MANSEIIRGLDIPAWYAHLEKINNYDVYYFPEYAKTCDLIEKGEMYLFVFEDNDHIFYYPFRMRCISDIQALSDYSGWYDITTDYGYGGPIIWTYDGNVQQTFIHNAIQCFNSFCQDQHIVTEFCRFHPLYENALNIRPYYDPIFCNKTVWVDLSLSEQACFKQFRSGHRSDIRKANQHGIHVELCNFYEHLDTFYTLYIQTMQRVNASKFYFFKKEFFESTLKNLKNHSGLFVAMYQGVHVASGIYIWGHKWIHYHFGVVSREMGNIGAEANKALQYYVMMWGKNKGLEKLHLGGGAGGSDTDSLMFFKSGFSSQRAEFYIAKKIHNSDMYRKLCEAVNMPETNSFFPAYRAIER